MPIFVTDEEEFVKITERARECRVKRLEKEGIAKVKARTKRYLYTIKVPLEKLDEFLKRLKCPEIVEV
ncbi:MAG: 5'-nucleotidase [Thermoprotei archaeon]|nr:MAG: 5'-nucleotidase [Thermoprotei archaeon]